MELINFFKTPAKNNEQRILKVFLIVILPLMAILTSVTIVDYQHSKNEFLSKIIRDESANANKRIAAFFDPIFRDLQFIQSWGNEGKLDPENKEELQDDLKDFSKFYLQNTKEVFFYNGKDTWKYDLKDSNKTMPTQLEGPRHDLEKTLSKNDPKEIEWIPGDYNPETQQSYLFAETVFAHPKSKDVYAVGLHVETTDFVQGLSKHITSPQRLLLLPKDNQRPPNLFDYKEDGTPTILRTNLPVMEKATKVWNNDEIRESFPFIHEGKAWWGSILKLDIKTINNQQMYSALLIPESTILTSFRQGRISLPIYASIVTIIALLATIFLWRRYYHELKMATRPPLLTEMSDDELMNAINAGEGDQLEFKSTLRWNLKANKPGKEIEISALKTIVAFLNSEGGTLITGVEDNGNILGIEADNFPNEDKFMLHFNNLIKQHIGLVPSKFIVFKTRPLEGKNILIVDCEKSDKAVFLKKDADEHFFIRVGPGSRKLTFTETMNYLKKKR